jgi:hypothetical protein
MWLALSKKAPKFYSDPTKDPSFEKLQAKWYARLKKEGFDDQEDHNYSDKPLRRWSFLKEVGESPYKDAERFQYHPEFKDRCKELCGHGNTRLTPRKVRLIWVDYCQGRTIRQSEVKYGISDTTIFRVIQRITEWMNLMDTRPEQSEPEEVTTIVLRSFNPDTDNGLLYSTWRNALWYDEKRDERRASEFYSAATQAIRDLLAGPKTLVRIACSKEDPEFIVGYSVMIGEHLEWAYVKISYREKGIAKLLTKGFKTVAPASTKLGRKIIEKLNLEVKKNHETIQ